MIYNRLSLLESFQTLKGYELEEFERLDESLPPSVPGASIEKNSGDDNYSLKIKGKIIDSTLKLLDKDANNITCSGEVYYGSESRLFYKEGTDKKIRLVQSNIFNNESQVRNITNICSSEFENYVRWVKKDLNRLENENPYEAYIDSLRQDKSKPIKTSVFGRNLKQSGEKKQNNIYLTVSDILEDEKLLKSFKLPASSVQKDDWTLIYNSENPKVRPNSNRRYTQAYYNPDWPNFFILKLSEPNLGEYIMFPGKVYNSEFELCKLYSPVYPSGVTQKFAPSTNRLNPKDLNVKIKAYENIIDSSLINSQDSKYPIRIGQDYFYKTDGNSLDTILCKEKRVDSISIIHQLLYKYYVQSKDKTAAEYQRKSLQAYLDENKNVKIGDAYLNAACSFYNPSMQFSLENLEDEPNDTNPYNKENKQYIINKPLWNCQRQDQDIIYLKCPKCQYLYKSKFSTRATAKCPLCAPDAGGTSFPELVAKSLIQTGLPKSDGWEISGSERILDGLESDITLKYDRRHFATIEYDGPRHFIKIPELRTRLLTKLQSKQLSPEEINVIKYIGRLDIENLNDDAINNIINNIINYVKAGTLDNAQLKSLGKICGYEEDSYQVKSLIQHRRDVRKSIYCAQENIYLYKIYSSTEFKQKVKAGENASYEDTYLWPENMTADITKYVKFEAFEGSYNNDTNNKSKGFIELIQNRVKNFLGPNSGKFFNTFTEQDIKTSHDNADKALHKNRLKLAILSYQPQAIVQAADNKEENINSMIEQIKKSTYAHQFDENRLKKVMSNYKTHKTPLNISQLEQIWLETDKATFDK